MKERLKLFNMDKEHLATGMQDRVSPVFPPVLRKQKSGSPVGVKERQEATSLWFGSKEPAITFRIKRNAKLRITHDSKKGNLLENI